MTFLLHILHELHPHFLIRLVDSIHMPKLIKRQPLSSVTGQLPKPLIVDRHIMSVDQEILLLFFHISINASLDLLPVEQIHKVLPLLTFDVFIVKLLDAVG